MHTNYYVFLQKNWPPIGMFTNLRYRAKKHRSTIHTTLVIYCNPRRNELPHPRETIRNGTENHTRCNILRSSIVPDIGQYQFCIYKYFEVAMPVPVRMSTCASMCTCLHDLCVFRCVEVPHLYCSNPCSRFLHVRLISARLVSPHTMLSCLSPRLVSSRSSNAIPSSSNSVLSRPV